MSEHVRHALEPLFGTQLLPIVVYEPRTRRIQYVNDAAISHYALPREALEQKRIDELGPHPDSDTSTTDTDPGVREVTATSEVTVAGRSYYVAAINPADDSIASQSVAARQQRFQRQRESLRELAQDPAFANGRFPEALDTLLRVAAAALDVRRLGFWRLTQSPHGLCCERLYDGAHDRICGGAFLDGEQCPDYIAAAAAEGRVLDASDAHRDPRLSELRDYLQQNRISSLLDAPIRLRGEMIGVLCHEHVGEPRVWEDDEIRFAGEVADQLAQALLNAERRRYQGLLRGMASLVGPETGDAFCRALVTNVAELLDAACVFIAQCHPDDRDQAQILALAGPDGLTENIALDLTDPLCLTTLRNGVHVVPYDLAYRHPDQPWGTPRDGASFIGIRLADHDGTTLGLMGAIGRERITEDEDAVALLRVFADRAAVELARLHREPHLLRAAAVLDNVSEGIAVTREDGGIVEANPALADLTGHDADTLSERSLRDFIIHPGLDAIREFMNRHGRWQGEVTARGQDRDDFPAWLTLTRLPGDGTGVGLPRLVALISDISGIRASQAELEHLAHHDPLTGLPNRGLLQHRLDDGLNSSAEGRGTLALLFLDLDGFKDVNDSLGHSQGDELLKHVAARLQAATRSGDTLARIGGDEFIVLLNGLDQKETAGAAASRLLAAFHQPYQVADHEVFVTASIGVSIHPRDGTTVESLIQNADAAMYDAKAMGKNTFRFFMPALTEQAFERVALVSALRQALERDEFYLCFQPQIELANGRITSCEALIRWQQPDGRIVPPGEFIPVAERSGLMVALGQWVLEAACHQARQWLDEGVAFGRIAVNVATAQISQTAFAEELIETLERTGLPAEYLAIEITESLFLEPHDRIARTLRIIRDTGVEIAIDDFGTGYSSLAYLKRLPIDTVKLDKSFTDDIPGDADGVSIAQAIIGLADNLGLAVIAEGIEADDQELFLATLRCQRGQGFLYAQPVPSEQYREMLQARDDDAPEAADHD